MESGVNKKYFVWRFTPDRFRIWIEPFLELITFISIFVQTYFTETDVERHIYKTYAKKC